MKRKTYIILAMLIFAMTVANCRTCLASDSQAVEYESIETVEFMEIFMISVNCTTAHVEVAGGVIATNETLVHFPRAIDMNAEELKNATQILLSVSTSNSILYFVFNNTEAVWAERYANITVEYCFEPYFHLGFKHNSTVSLDGLVNVTFTGVGAGNLTEFTELLMVDCLAPDLGGFSSTFLPITRENSTNVQLVARKASGSFEWAYAMGVIYDTIFPDGMGEHKVDVLDLLNVESLAPSKYALQIGAPSPFYRSIVTLTISSDTSVTFISCTPPQATPPNRGWNISPQISPNQLEGTFLFGGEDTPVDELSLTFSGFIIPEFMTQTCTATLALIPVAVAILKKRFSRINS